MSRATNEKNEMEVLGRERCCTLMIHNEAQGKEKSDM
jgi:hypothetical protein